MVLLSSQEYLVENRDCIECLSELPPQSLDCLITSVPFPALYSYTSLPNDIGNSENPRGDMKLHFGYLYRQLVRVMKPGRVVCIHVMNIPRMKRSGGQGLFDFRGFNIRLGERAGLFWDYDWVIRKPPQQQAIRTKSRALQFSGLESDRAKSRGALPDYILKFLAPGANAVPVDSDGEVSRNDWIDLAECTWTGLRDTETLNIKGTKSEEDTRHICPFSIPLVEKLVKLFSNPGEVVADPFMGIGTVAYCALKLDRKSWGAEIKPEYHTAALANCERALRLRKEQQRSLFDAVTANGESKE